MASHLRWAILLAADALLVATVNFVAAAEVRQAPEFVAAIRENGDRLRSGIYTAIGTREVLSTPSEANSFDEESERGKRAFEETIEAAFDHDQKKLHFSRQRKLLAGEEAGESEQSREVSIILTPQESIQVWMNKPDGIANVSIASPVTTQSAPEYFQPVIDVRTVAISSLRSLNHPFESRIERINEVGFQDISATDGILRYRAESPYLETMYSKVVDYWVDPNQGYQVVRLTVRNGVSSNPQSLGEPVVATETTWIQIGDVWLPETVELLEVSAQTERLRLSFTWESVNEPVPESWFTWQGLDLPKGSRVADTSIVDDVIIPVAVVGQSLEQEIPPRIHESEEPGKSRLTWVLILVNLLIVGCVVGWFLRHRTM